MSLFSLFCSVPPSVNSALYEEGIYRICTCGIGADLCEALSEAIPDITPLVKPTTLGDIATYFFFSAGGLFIGGETGILTGSASASRSITRDPDSRTRIEAAFRKFRADVLRKEADDLDGGKGVAGVLGF